MAVDLADDDSTSPTGYGILNIDVPVAYVSYGAWAIVATIVPPLLYNMLMRGQDIWGSVGYKFAAYAHFYIWFPVSLFWIITMGSKNSVSLTIFNFFNKLSMAGPFLLYPIACYYMFRWGTSEMWYGWFAAAMFTLYTGVSIFG